jgi:hypothetical protein
MRLSCPRLLSNFAYPRGVQNESRLREWVAQALGAAWLAVFLFLALRFATVRPLAPAAFAAMALGGMAYAAVFERERLRLVLVEQRLLLGAALLTVAAILAAGALLAWRMPERPSLPLPAQLGMLLCIAPLAVMLGNRRRLQAMVLLFAALSAAHLFALPFEAVTGEPVFGWGEALYPRDLGPLHFQARGMAWQIVYFPGVYMALFYFAAGGLGEERLFGRWTFGPRSWLAVSLAWTAAVACLQSRSALAGALAASLLGLVAFGHVRRPRLWIAAGAIALAGLALFAWLFSENKSSGSLRWAYLALYVQRSFDPAWLLTGRGYTHSADPEMQVPGLQFVVHSHNDFAQVFFTWGLPVLLAYGFFWFALMRLAWRSWQASRYWPALALVACAPSFLTDLGLHHHEKTAMLAIFAGMAIALAPRPSLRT